MQTKVIFSIILALLVAPLILVSTAIASTDVSLFQITSEGSQQSSPFVFKDLVVYGSLGEIWGYDLKKEENFEILNRTGGQFITNFSDNLVIYEDTPDGESTPDVRMYDVKENKDELVAGGTGAQAGGVTNGDFVIYVDGGACGNIHAYNIKQKEDSIISPTGCQPLRVSGDIVVFAIGASGGTNIHGYNLKKNTSFDVVTDPDFQESPNIFNDNVVYVEYTTGGLGDYQAIKMKNIRTGEKRTIYETFTSAVQSPAISDKYVVWSESTAQHVGGVKGANLKTGEVFEVQPQGPHQNSHTTPAIWKDTAVWMAWRTGNGDIYGATLKH